MHRNYTSLHEHTAATHVYRLHGEYNYAYDHVVNEGNECYGHNIMYLAAADATALPLTPAKRVTLKAQIKSTENFRCIYIQNF